MTTLVPDPLDSEQQYNRFHHLDLADMETGKLQKELDTLKSVLWWNLPDNDWLEERVNRLKAELRRRGLRWQ
jgi:hypothetical protein